MVTISKDVKKIIVYECPRGKILLKIHEACLEHYRVCPWNMQTEIDGGAQGFF